MNAGRNDPCPCGSGKKYKKCCLLRDEASAGQATGMSRDSGWRDEALSRLMAFASRPSHSAEFDDAMEEFFSEELLEGTLPRKQVSAALEASQPSFMSWYCFDYYEDDDEPEKTIANRFLTEEDHRLTERQCAHVERLSRSRLSVYEVQSIELDHGFEVVDLLSNASLHVRERAATRGLSRFDLLAMRLVPFEDGVLEIEGGLMVFPARCKPTLVRFLADERRVATHKRPKPANAQAFTKDPGFGADLQRIWLDLVAFPPLPKIVTSEGDPLLFSKVVFDITRERAAVEVALDAHPELERMDDGEYEWGEAAGVGRRGLGAIHVDKRRITLETMSRERALRGRRLLEDVLGPAVRYRATALEDPSVALRERRSEDPRRPAPPPVPTEVDAQVIREHADRYYREWIDKPVPALDGKTPREAARKKASRTKLVDLLKNFENSEERGARDGRPRYDFSWLWTELGLKP